MADRWTGGLAWFGAIDCAPQCDRHAQVRDELKKETEEKENAIELVRSDSSQARQP